MLSGTAGCSRLILYFLPCTWNQPFLQGSLYLCRSVHSFLIVFSGICHCGSMSLRGYISKVSFRYARAVFNYMPFQNIILYICRCFSKIDSRSEIDASRANVFVILIVIARWQSTSIVNIYFASMIETTYFLMPGLYRCQTTFLSIGFAKNSFTMCFCFLFDRLFTYVRATFSC